ncbi:eugenol synthase 1-like isoform X2 [Salvia splendens]|uniref:eugenol synthase 1-like isoform X2 n=1 Tax=Salvia splendens TaxID=180675 RepID=UPI001C260310|nr:eugenol synthase 1-like isoform X2 [Salvia splendens]
MEKIDRKNKILIFGGSGYIGSYMVKASLKLGHPTYVFSRPNSSKPDLLNHFHSLGAIIVNGMLDEHEKLVSLMKKVDIVISAVAYPQVLDQFKILEAIKIAGYIKRFLPSDFGVEEDKIRVLPPFEAFLDKKRRIRRAIEEAQIPYTFVSANCFGGYFINYLLHPSDPNKEEITVYGDGQAKFVMNYEDDIGLYTIKVANDPRTCNRTVIYRPSTNVITQLELISLWEKKSGRNFKKIHASEEEIVALSKRLPAPDNIPVAILHSVFIKGVTTGYDFAEKDVEASSFYPDMKFTTVDELLHIFLKHDGPKPALVAFQ